MRLDLHQWIRRTILAGSLALSAGFAVAQDRPLQDIGPQAPAPSWEEFRSVVDRLEATEGQLKALQSAASDSDHQHVQADGNPNVPSAEQRLSALEKSAGKDAGPRFPAVKLTGFFHADAGYFNQDATNMATLGDIQDGVGFRRARLQAVGRASEFTNYSIEMDFGTAGRPSFMDVWGEQTNLPVVGNLRIGHYRQPTTMDSLTPVRNLWFLERSLPFQAFDPFRRVGIMAYDKSEDENTSWAYGVYRTGGFNNSPLGDTRYATDIGDNGGYSFATRATHLLWYDEPSDGRYLLHTGGSYNYSRLTGGTPNGNIYEARAIPEFFVGDPSAPFGTATGTPPFVDTGRLPADQYQLFNVQLAGQYGPAHFQAEYMATVVDQIGAPNVFYDGAYVQAGYFLTGENWTYNRTFGVFEKVTPHTDFFGLGRDSYICGWGAWEATARWSYVDLSDPNAAPVGAIAGPPPVPNPGSMNDITLGMNWYWNAYTKMQFNYIHCFLDNDATGTSDCDIYCARFQVSF